MNIWLYSILFVSGFFLSNAKGAGFNNMEHKIILLPIGKVDGWVLDILEKDLAKTFECKIERHMPIDLPGGAYNPERGQHYSSLILKKVHELIEVEKQDKVFGITDVDLYTAGLNFVFGEAELGGQSAIISLTRLRQSYYSLPENKTIFAERTIKEAVHELGHVFGLEHCPDPECVMYFSNSLLDTDRKSVSFCPQCRARWQKSIR